MLNFIRNLIRGAAPLTLPQKLARQTAMDDQLLAVLEKHKAKIDELHDVDHAFACKSKAGAEAIVAELRSRGYTVDDADSTWVEFQQKVAPSQIKMITRQFVQLAHQHDAEYDGWGTQPRL